MIPVSKLWSSEAGQHLQLRFFSLDREASKKDVQRAMQRLKVEVQAVGQKLQGALMFSCNGRGPKNFLGMWDSAVDLGAFQEAFPSVPISG